MFMGHYGVSFALKRWAPRLSLGWLFVGVQLIDWIWAVLVIAGIEQLRIVYWLPASPADFYYMPYTHSIEGALAWAILAGVATLWLFRGSEHQRRAAMVAMGAAVFSHWALDLLVHRRDLGLLGDAYKVGLSFYDHPVAEAGLELVILAAGLLAYTGSTRPRNRGAGAALLWLTALLVAINLLVTFGPRPELTPRSLATFNLAIYALTAGAAAWVDRMRTPTDPVTGAPL